MTPLGKFNKQSMEFIGKFSRFQAGYSEFYSNYPSWILVYQFFDEIQIKSRFRKSYRIKKLYLKSCLFWLQKSSLCIKSTTISRMVVALLLIVIALIIIAIFLVCFFHCRRANEERSPLHSNRKSHPIEIWPNLLSLFCIELLWVALLFLCNNKSLSW